MRGLTGLPRMYIKPDSCQFWVSTPSAVARAALSLGPALLGDIVYMPERGMPKGANDCGMNLNIFLDMQPRLEDGIVATAPCAVAKELTSSCIVSFIRCHL